jgi:hypothetical protein
MQPSMLRSCHILPSLLCTAAFLRHPAPRAQLVDALPPLSGSVKGLLVKDSREAIAARALKEKALLEPNMQEMKLPTRTPKAKVGKKKGSKGGGFGSGGFGSASSKVKGKQGGKESAAPPLPVRSNLAEQALALRADVLDEKGVCLVPGVLSKEAAQALHTCIGDELAAAYAAVEADPANSLGRFNVPAETFDPQRGYLLLPLVDEKSVAAGNGKNSPLVGALRELLAPGAPLADLFHEMCGGNTGKKASPELYDLVGLRTEAGASRQPIHSDTPYQKIPGLFCAFIAPADVRFEQGSTAFLPGTHTGSKGPRKAFDEGQLDAAARDEMLSKAQARYTMLKAGDAVVFNMNTLHAGTANFALEDGGGQRLLYILTFRNLKAKENLGHLPNLRFGYRDRGITLADMQAELSGDDPFAGIHARDELPFGDGLLS